MKYSTSSPLLAAALALFFACGAAQAQFKAKSKSKEPLGSGLYVPPAVEAPMGVPAGSATAAPPAEDKRELNEIVEDIARCMLGTIPRDWTSAKVEVVELGREGKDRQFEANFTYAGADGKEAPFSPCNARETATNMYKLNAALDPAKRNWIKATLVLSKEGKFKLNYEYAKTGGSASPADSPGSATGTK